MEAIRQIDLHTDTIYCVAWNFDGSLLATTSKDKKIRVIDPLTGDLKGEGKGHEGSKSSQIVFTSASNMLYTTGFSRMSERQYAIWDSNSLDKPKKLEMIDTGSGVLFPRYDPDTNVMFVAGKVGAVIHAHCGVLLGTIVFCLFFLPKDLPWCIVATDMI